jgi:hydroxyethylthiazole kinase-like sugar kinase family protein
VIGAFAALAGNDPRADDSRRETAGEALLEAVVAGAALFAICGEIAAEASPGPGTLQTALLDKLANITRSEFTSRLKIGEGRQA